MPDYKLIGKNYQTPDLVAKVTGRAKYAEDFRAEGMLFCKQLLSPEPHARVRHIDAREALAMSGVAAMLTADELPIVRPEPDPTGAEESEDGSPCLTNEPVFEGEPILAVAAVDEPTAAAASNAIRRRIRVYFINVSWFLGSSICAVLVIGSRTSLFLSAKAERPVKTRQVFDPMRSGW